MSLLQNTTKRKRCPNGSRKNKQTGKCETQQTHTAVKRTNSTRKKPLNKFVKKHVATLKKQEQDEKKRTATLKKSQNKYANMVNKAILS